MLKASVSPFLSLSLDTHPFPNSHSLALLNEADQLVRSAISVASSKKSELSMRSNLGEILRAKGDLEEAEAALRMVMEEQEAAGVQDHQVQTTTPNPFLNVIVLYETPAADIFNGWR